MDGKGRYADNIFMERLWRTVKYEEVYLKAYSNGREAKAGLEAYLHFYNTQRPHQPWVTGHRPRCSVETRCNQMNSQREEVAANQSIGRPWKDSGTLT